MRTDTAHDPAPTARPGGTAARPTAGAPVSVAEAYLVALKQRGIDHFYIGAGTDTAPIVEAYARQPESGLDFPKPVVTVHENLAVGMAHGYYMVARRPQAVMLHVTVGAANAVCGLMNAARAQVPIFFTAGRTPLFEQGRLGARNSPIHWAQEMYDQAGMARELVKWDYELRDGIQVDAIVDRALTVAMAEPRGPIYLTLPREVLAQPAAEPAAHRPAAMPAAPHPDPAAVARIAEAVAGARFPVVVGSASGADPSTVPLLAALLSTFGIGYAESMGHHVNLPSDHELFLGIDSTRVLAQADVVIVLESDVPWIPARGGPAPDAFVAHVGVDPLHQGIPVRSFPSDCTVVGQAGAFLQALHGALSARGAEAGAQARRERLLPVAAAWRQELAQAVQRDDQAGGPISKVFLSRCIDMVRPADSIVISEYSLRAEHVNFTHPGTYFLNSTAGGLGWGFPAALGAQQAAPQRTVIAVQGDGSYLFANPAACHQAAAMHQLPVLMVVFNNQHYLAVEQATLAVYPDGAARRWIRERGPAPLSDLTPVPAFEMYATASGGYGERVTAREHLLPALGRALHAVQVEKRHALLNVIGA